MLEVLLIGEGYEVHSALSTDEAVSILDSHDIDLVISDMNMPSIGGIGLLKASMERDKNRPVVMVTAYATAENAVEAMKLGAFDYIIKPFNVDELKIIVKNGLERKRLLVENTNLKERLEMRGTLDDMIGGSKEIADIKDVVSRVAKGSSTVLITGESGTGKELIARAIHTLSPRSDKSFYSINCGAVPEELMESELFGHVKGSFTGATSNKTGLLEAAEGGTFFLDEVAEMPVGLQVKLLRAVQEREIRRVGGNVYSKVDVRFIAATNRNPEKSVEKGELREDLYYRLNVIRIAAPPLRERRGDIPLLAAHFLAKFNEQNDRNLKGFTPEVMNLLENYFWRGNVRELSNMVERAVVLETREWITSESLPQEMYETGSGGGSFEMPSGGIDLEEKLTDLERRIITDALKKTDGSKREAAKLLRVNLRSFRYKLSKYGL